MKGNRSQDTRPERAVRSAVHALGLRFRKQYKIQTTERSVRVDFAFPRQRIAVFVDGCYWHSCPAHGTKPVKNTHYWTAKLRRNVERDVLVNRSLAKEGWRVLRIWEHESPVQAASCVQKFVLDNSK